MHLYISGQVANFVQMANNSVSGGSTQRSQQCMTMHCVGLQRDEGAKTGQGGGKRVRGEVGKTDDAENDGGNIFRFMKISSCPCQ